MVSASTVNTGIRKAGISGSSAITNGTSAIRRITGTDRTEVSISFTVKGRATSKGGVARIQRARIPVGGTIKNRAARGDVTRFNGAKVGVSRTVVGTEGALRVHTSGIKCALMATVPAVVRIPRCVRAVAAELYRGSIVVTF